MIELTANARDYASRSVAARELGARLKAMGCNRIAFRADKRHDAQPDLIIARGWLA